MQRTIHRILTSCLCLLALSAPASASAASDLALTRGADDAHFDFVASSARVESEDAPADLGLRGKVNLNTATPEQLELLPGIGPSTASKIVAYRQRYPFKETLHLLRVKGVGRKTFAKLKPYLSVTGDSDLEAVGGKAKKKKA